MPEHVQGTVDDVTVATTAGPVVGSWVSGGVASREILHLGGVPYAEAERFGLPRAPTPWTAPRDATHPGAAPPQRTEGLELVPGMAPAHTAEACLTAEVWTPGTGSGRPILVWIPGGSFRIGGAGLPTYDGRHLAADGDMVVVGLNYRLGALGFLASDGVPSNLGLRDLLVAIDWIRANAAAFGGDAERITLMGESAGAGAITHLLTRPDLPIAGAIVLSGSATMTLDAPTAQRVAARTLELAGVADAAALAGVPVDDVLDAQMRAVADLAATVGMMPFHPWVDGDVVPAAPLDAATADALAPVPLVLGTTAHEMELFRDVVPVLPAEHAVGFLTARAAPLGCTRAAVAAGLEACGGDLVAAIADVNLHLPALRIAESHARRGLPVWRASFTWESAEHRACHAVDLPFHFGTLDVAGWREFAGAVGNPAADELSRRLRLAWAAFAATGTPACEPIGDWPGWGTDRAVVALGPEVTAGDDPDGERLRSWG